MNTNDPLATPENTVIRNGFRTFDLKTLTRTKLNTLVGDKPRSRARDLYDAAWLMEQHMEDIAPDQRLKLRAVIHGPILDASDEWASLFESDDIMARSSLDQVWESLDANLDRDPIVLFREDPNGRLTLKKQGDRQVMTFSGKLFDAQTIGAFVDRKTARRWLRCIDPDGTLPPLKRPQRPGGPKG